MVTEVGTGLGMLGLADLDEVLATRPAVMRSLAPEDWDTLAQLRAGGAYDAEFHAAWENGRAFLRARDGLRSRLPESVEWKGVIRAPGDEVAPVDLRVDHVYLVSCKYLSNILFNVAPAHIFDHLLVGGTARARRATARNWFDEVATDSHQVLYDLVRLAVAEQSERLDGQVTAVRPQNEPDAPSFPGLDPGTPDRAAAAVTHHPAVVLRALPARASDLTPPQRSALGKWLARGWPPEAKGAYETLCEEVAHASVARWRAALSGGQAAAEAMVWRLLRIGATPYFVLGSSTTQSLRLRIATGWDWRQHYALGRMEIFAQSGGQPRVGWSATVKSRASGETQTLSGHVEVRWSHGRFGGPPEAKGYLDTPHQDVPGYFALR
jgi:hypothetical protein